MLTTLVVGQLHDSHKTHSLLQNKGVIVKANDGDFPRSIQKWMIAMHKEENSEFIVFTKNPVALDAFTCKHDEKHLSYEDILFSHVETGTLTPLLNIKSEDFLGHFALADLYISGLFDEALGLK